MVLPSAPRAREPPRAVPARAELLGGCEPPVEEVERTPLRFASCCPVTASRFGTFTTLPGAGARWRVAPVRLFMVRGSAAPTAPPPRAAPGAGLLRAVEVTPSAISALDFVTRVLTPSASAPVLTEPLSRAPVAAAAPRLRLLPS